MWMMEESGAVYAFFAKFKLYLFTQQGVLSVEELLIKKKNQQLVQCGLADRKLHKNYN